MIAPDEHLRVLKAKPSAPQGVEWMPRCHAGARSAPIRMRASTLRGHRCVHPRAHDYLRHQSGMVMPLGGAIPRISRMRVRQGARIHGFHGGEVMLGKPVDVVLHRKLHQWPGWRISRPLPAS